MSVSHEPGSWASPHLYKLQFCLFSLIIFASANGYDGSLMGCLQALPLWQTFMKNPTGAYLGIINAIYWFGMLFSYLFSASLSNRYGRKLSLYIGILMIAVASALQAAANNEAAFIVSRALAGCAAGLWSSTAPVLISEVAYPSHRAIVSALYQCGFYIGSTLAAWVTLGTYNVNTSWSWRIPSLIQVVLPLLALPGLIMAPESPRWLFSQGRSEEAIQVLATWHAAGDLQAPVVNTQVQDIRSSMEGEVEAAKASYADMVKTKGNRRRLLITLTLALFSQWGGNGVVSFYLVPILGTIGITDAKTQLVITACLAIWNLLFSVGSASMVDRFGKRPMFLLSAGTMLASYVAITALSASFAENGNKAVGIAIWTYNLRSRGLTLVWTAAASLASFNILVNPIALEAIAWKFYFVFMGVIVAYGLTAYFIYPETRGYSLESIAVLFDKKDVIQGAIDDSMVTGKAEKPEDEVLD
ncbi:hypothetical protein EsH8_XI_000023 [Colletotrichum jinshuiense]